MTTTNSPFISIIIPVYNVQDYLHKCLDSILQQTYQNIEILLVNDGSTDTSGEICDYYRTLDTRIQVIHQCNQGISAARNTGFSHSHGEYILFVDSDDFIHPQMLSYMLYEMQRNNADLVCCKKKRVEPNFPLPTDSLDANAYSVTLYDDYKAFYEIYNPRSYTDMIVCWNKLYPRDLVSSFPFPPNRIHEDEHFSPRVLANSKTVAFIEYPFYFYVQRPNSIMKKPLTKKSLDKLTSLAENVAYFKETNHPEKSILENIRLFDYSISLCVTFRTQKNKELEKEIRTNFINTYRSLNKNDLPIRKRIKYDIFYRFYSLFIWQEIYLKKLKRILKH